MTESADILEDEGEGIVHADRGGEMIVSLVGLERNGGDEGEFVGVKGGIGVIEIDFDHFTARAGAETEADLMEEDGVGGAGVVRRGDGVAIFGVIDAVKLLGEVGVFGDEEFIGIFVGVLVLDLMVRGAGGSGVEFVGFIVFLRGGLVGRRRVISRGAGGVEIFGFDDGVGGCEEVGFVVRDVEVAVAVA